MAAADTVFVAAVSRQHSRRHACTCACTLTWQRRSLGPKELIDSKHVCPHMHDLSIPLLLAGAHMQPLNGDLCAFVHVRLCVRERLATLMSSAVKLAASVHSYISAEDSSCRNCTHAQTHLCVVQHADDLVLIQPQRGTHELEHVTRHAVKHLVAFGEVT